MSKVEGGGRTPPPLSLEASCNYFFFEASRVNLNKVYIVAFSLIILYKVRRKGKKDENVKLDTNTTTIVTLVENELLFSFGKTFRAQALSSARGGMGESNVFKKLLKSTFF